MVSATSERPMAKAKKPSIPPIVPPPKKDDGRTIRVSTEVHRMCRWIARLEEGGPTSQSIIDWAALDRIRTRFLPLEEAAKRLEADEREAEERLERERQELRKGKPE